jgi:hypothetical protein
LELMLAEMIQEFYSKNTFFEMIAWNVLSQICVLMYGKEKSKTINLFSIAKQTQFVSLD